MLDLRLSENEARMMVTALDERLHEMFGELVHTDDRTLKRALVQRHTELEALAKRIHNLLDMTAPPVHHA